MPGPLGPGELTIVVAIAGVAGFVTGLAGFGTGLVAAGLWLQVLPAQLVPPLVMISSVAGQVIGLSVVHRAITWRALGPYLGGALVGVPLGTITLGIASPASLRMVVGVLILAFATFEVVVRGRREVGSIGGRAADALVGTGGGFLGGFAGLSGPLPVIWLRLRGGSPDAQRAIYQPFNLLVLSFAALTMAFAGRLSGTVFVLAGLCFPATLLGAALGVRSYRTVNPTTFRRAVLGLLVISGAALTLGR